MESIDLSWSTVLKVAVFVLVGWLARELRYRQRARTLRNTLMRRRGDYDAARQRRNRLPRR